MSELRALALLPSVPRGSDYEASRRLFADLGFEELWENESMDSTVATRRDNFGRLFLPGVETPG